MTKKLIFLEPDTSEPLKRISARVPYSLYQRFQAAQKLAAESGLELSITQVVRKGLLAACDEAEQVCRTDEGGKQ